MVTKARTEQQRGGGGWSGTSERSVCSSRHAIMQRGVTTLLRIENQGDDYKGALPAQRLRSQKGLGAVAKRQLRLTPIRTSWPWMMLPGRVGIDP